MSTEHEKALEAVGWHPDRVIIWTDNVTFGGRNMADEKRKSKTRSFSTTESNSERIDRELQERGIGISDLLHEVFSERYGDEWEERNPKGDAMRIERIRRAKDSQNS